MKKRISTAKLFGFGSSEVNKPQSLPIQNIPEGVVEVSDLYLWIRWTLTGKRDQYRIESKDLYAWTKKPVAKLSLGNLSFRLVGENVVCIEPSCSECDTLEVTVSLFRLNEALRFFFE